MTKSLKILIIFLLFCQISGKALASGDDNSPKFNFNDDYQGEDNFKIGNDQIIYDPFEPFNRKVFAINETLDKYFAEPVVKEYRKQVPRPIRNSVRSFLNNLSAPFSVINSLLQGDGHNAMASFSSFLINSTVGIAGIFDVAGDKNIQYNQEDFGQTLAKYGSGSGPYLVLPVVGPSNLRDFTGFVTEKLVNPLTFNALDIGGKRELVNSHISLFLALSSGIDTRESLIEVLDDMRKNSFDTYATIRSAYLQRRKSLTQNK